MAPTIFNPMNRTWAIPAPPRGPNGHFGPEQASWQGEDCFAYFEFVENPFKSGKCLKPKAYSSFIGDVGLIKVGSEFSFGHPKCRFLYPNMGTFAKCAHLYMPKMAFRVPEQKFGDHFYKPNIPQK